MGKLGFDLSPPVFREGLEGLEMLIFNWDNVNVIQTP